MQEEAESPPKPALKKAARGRAKEADGKENNGKQTEAPRKAVVVEPKPAAAAKPAPKGAPKAAAPKAAAPKAAKTAAPEAKRLFQESDQTPDDPRMVKLQNEMSAMAQAQKESAELLRKAVRQNSPRKSRSPAKSDISFSSNTTSDLMISSMTTMSESLTSRIVGACDKLNETHAKDADTWKERYERAIDEKRKLEELLMGSAKEAAAAVERAQALGTALEESKRTSKIFQVRAAYRTTPPAARTSDAVCVRLLMPPT